MKDKSEEFLQEIGMGKRKASDAVSGLNKLYLELLQEHTDKRAKLGPYYISIKAKNRRGLLADILKALEEQGFDVFDDFPANPGEAEVVLVLGVNVFGGRYHGGIVGQIQRMQVRTIAREKGKKKEKDRVKVQQLNIGQFQKLRAARDDWARNFSF